jgi:aspartyl-tRNA(Asn)/glutamyl-tRNA(Gln) amidotransferase subunit A
MPALLPTAHAIARRETTALAEVEAALAAIAAADPALHAFLETFPDHARKRAEEIDRRLSAKDPVGPLAGVPIAVKDNLATTLGRTTCGSRILENYRSPFDAFAVERLVAAGAVVVGKTNLDEFGMGSTTANSAFGPTLNPWDTSRVPGGSSGGSAAAVAARLVPGALGSDTGGSVRQPAGWCGVVGLKPTYGRVSRRGLVAYASSLDTIGTLATTVADAAALLSVIAGFDPGDSTCTPTPPEDLCADIDKPLPNLRIGVPKQAIGPGNTPAVGAAFDAALEVFSLLGAEVVEVDLLHAPQAVAAYYLIATAEASSNLARFDGVRYGRRADGTGTPPDLAAMYRRSRTQGLGQEVQRRIMLGTHALSAGYADQYYGNALKARRLIRSDYTAAFGKAACHVLATPTSPGPALRLGEKADDPLAMYLEDVYTVGVSLAGLPALSLPCGFAIDPVPGPNGNETPLPIGLQLIGPSMGERVLLRVARMFERATTWHTRKPPSPI